jgi:deoxyribonuclease-1-like protein
LQYLKRRMREENMRRAVQLVALIAVLAGGWYAWSQYGERLKRWARSSGPEKPATVAGAPVQPPVPERLRSIRIATFNVSPLDERKLTKPFILMRLAQTLEQFDLVALQDIQAPNQSVLVRLLEQVNAMGRHYDYVLPPQVGRDPVAQYSAFVFDRATVEVDRRTVYNVEDPTRQLRRQPLVASFRARGADPSQAFTFTLINVHVSQEQVSAELDLLDDVYRGVRDDGRNEDDIILLGSLETDDRHLGQLGQVPHLTCSVFMAPSTVQARLADNILFNRRATVEFTGRSGVLDLMRQFDMGTREVIELAYHFPVWAEFSIFEGGQAGHVAAAPTEAAR